MGSAILLLRLMKIEEKKDRVWKKKILRCAEACLAKHLRKDGVGPMRVTLKEIGSRKGTDAARKKSSRASSFARRRSSPKFLSSISDKSLRSKAKRALSLEICSH